MRWLSDFVPSYFFHFDNSSKFSFYFFQQKNYVQHWYIFNKHQLAQQFLVKVNPVILLYRIIFAKSSWLVKPLSLSPISLLDSFTPCPAFQLCYLLIDLDIGHNLNMFWFCFIICLLRNNSPQYKICSNMHHFFLLYSQC